MLRIFEFEINNGEKKSKMIPVGSYSNGSIVYIPVMVLCGKNQGSTLWITGAVHGDELNGSQAMWELFKTISPNSLYGNIIITPIANPLALLNREKISNIDYLDMDQVFPGDPNGLFTQRIAYRLFEEIKKHSDFLLSFHTLGSHYDAIPYTVSKKANNLPQEIINKSRQMALDFGLETNCFVDLSSSKDELPGATTGALDVMCMQSGIPAFMAEVGSGGKIDGSFVSLAYECTMNLLASIGIIKKPCKKPLKQYAIKSRKFLRADMAGIIKMNVSPGMNVSRGDEFYQTHYFSNEEFNAKFNEDSYIIATRINPVVSTGDRIAFVGTDWETLDNE
ncbi:MAG: M14 family metallopeptidase [Bacillota bacterium]|nr:M14 family metallopeptidase [Bacillota bacterium]